MSALRPSDLNTTNPARQMSEAGAPGGAANTPPQGAGHSDWFRPAEMTQLIHGAEVVIRIWGGTLYRGWVEHVARPLGILWIREHGLNSRLLLHLEDISSWRYPG